MPTTLYPKTPTQWHPPNAPYVPCEQLGTPLYYGTLNVQNGFFGILTRLTPFVSIPPLMIYTRMLIFNVQDKSTWIGGRPSKDKTDFAIYDFP